MQPHLIEIAIGVIAALAGGFGVWRAVIDKTPIPTTVQSERVPVSTQEPSIQTVVPITQSTIMWGVFKGMWLFAGTVAVLGLVYGLLLIAMRS